MPVRYYFDGPIAVLRAEGDYEPEDLKQGVLRALEDPACPAWPVMMFDLRASGSLARRSAEQVRDMADFLARHGNRFGRRLAMVVSSDVAYGLMRMGSAQAADGGVVPDVFRDFEAARAWLLRGAPGAGDASGPRKRG